MEWLFSTHYVIAASAVEYIKKNVAFLVKITWTVARYYFVYFLLSVILKFLEHFQWLLLILDIACEYKVKLGIDQAIKSKLKVKNRNNHKNFFRVTKKGPERSSVMSFCSLYCYPLYVFFVCVLRLSLQHKNTW